MSDVTQAYRKDTIGLSGIKLVSATIISCFIGSLASVGIGFYAPCLALAYLLGLSAKAAFPIMMCAGASCAVFTAYKFIQAGSYNRKVAITMACAAIVGVLLAAYVIESLPIVILNLVIIIVIFYAAISLFVTYCKGRHFV